MTIGYFQCKPFLMLCPMIIFLRVISAMMQSTGASFNEARCSLSEDLDPWEIPFGGVRFRISGESVDISCYELKHFVILASVIYISQHPEDKELLESILPSTVSPNT